MNNYAREVERLRTEAKQRGEGDMEPDNWYPEYLKTLDTDYLMSILSWLDEPRLHHRVAMILGEREGMLTHARLLQESDEHLLLTYPHGTLREWDVPRLQQLRCMGTQWRPTKRAFPKWFIQRIDAIIEGKLAEQKGRGPMRTFYTEAEVDAMSMDALRKLRNDLTEAGEMDVADQVQKVLLDRIDAEKSAQACSVAPDEIIHVVTANTLSGGVLMATTRFEEVIAHVLASEGTIRLTTFINGERVDFVSLKRAEPPQPAQPWVGPNETQPPRGEPC